MSVALPPSPYVQASEIEKLPQKEEEAEEEEKKEKEKEAQQSQLVVRPVPTPPSTQIPKPKNTLVAQIQRRGSGIVSAVAPIFGAAAAAVGAEAQKALVTNCPHCQNFLSQAQQGGVKDAVSNASRVFAQKATANALEKLQARGGWKNVLGNAARAIAPIAEKTAASAFDKVKSDVSWLALANKII